MTFVRFAPLEPPATWEDDLLDRVRDVRFGVLDGGLTALEIGQDELLDALASGRAVTDVARGAAEVLELSTVRLLAPIRPRSLRDFLAFEDHARGGAARRGEDLNPAWFEVPISYKGNARQILGPADPLSYPDWTDWLDFELELACVVGRPLSRATPEEAADAIAGYTIMNDWSARDVQRAEMAMRLGPARSKDFATSLGPGLVGASDFDPRAGAMMRARIDGDLWFEGSSAAMHWTFPQILSWVSQTEWLLPGDVIGSGTAFGGCGLDQDRRIPRACRVELEIEGIGTLRTDVT